jgi:hypothetical protein
LTARKRYHDQAKEAQSGKKEANTLSLKEDRRTFCSQQGSTAKTGERKHITEKENR